MKKLRARGEFEKCLGDSLNTELYAQAKRGRAHNSCETHAPIIRTLTPQGVTNQFTLIRR